MKLKTEHDALGDTLRRAAVTASSEGPDAVDLEQRPEVVLSVLEADQLVAAKERHRFGRMKLSPGVRALLWGLRFYVIAMIALVLAQVLQAVQRGH
jgi:hypothetical protein